VRIKEFKKQEKIRALATLFYDGPRDKWWGKSCKIFLWKEELLFPSTKYSLTLRKFIDCKYKCHYRSVRFYNDGTIYENRKYSRQESRRLQLLRY